MQKQTQANPSQIVPVSKLQNRTPIDDSILNRFDVVREEEKRMVRGKFIFHEIPKGTLGFMFKKYKGDALQKYLLTDGQIYTLPLAVARHLNMNCSYPSYEYKNDENGVARSQISERIRRTSFQSLEFGDGAGSAASGNDLAALR